MRPSEPLRNANCEKDVTSPKGISQFAFRFTFGATAVLLLAALLRVINLHDVPPGLAQDEVLNADIVQMIRGGYHALFFREGYGHEPLYHYWGVPFQVLLGDNVLAIRLPSVVLGLWVVALSMRWARREFGTATAVATGLGLAVSWWPIVFSRIGIRPILEPFLLLLMAWFWPRKPVVAGLFLGLSLYSYTGARVVFAIPILFALYEVTIFLWREFQRKDTKEQKAQRKNKKRLQIALLKTGKMLGVALFVSVPMFYVLQADPTLQQRVDQLSGPLDALRAGDFAPIWQSVTHTLGVFSFTGDPRWTYTLPHRPLFDWVTAVFFYVGLLIATWRIKQPRYAFLLIWLAVGLIPSAITPQSPSTIRIIGALPAVYVMVGLAVGEMVSGQWSVVSEQRTRYSLLATRYLLLVPLMGLLVVNIGRTVQDGFVRWPQAEETRLNHYQSVLLDMARYYDQNPSPIVVADGFFEPIDRDSLRRNLGVDPQARWVQTGSMVAGAVVIPAGAANGRFYIPEFAPPHPDLLTAVAIPDQPLYRSSAYPSFAVYALPATLPPPAQPTAVTFGEVITLTGYEILPPQEGEVALLTYWRIERPLPTDLAAFVHLLADDGAPLTQHDGWDSAAVTLQAGDVVVQRHLLPLPDTLENGDYQLQLGLYTRGNGRRLPPQGQPQDSFLLGSIHVDGK